MESQNGEWKRWSKFVLKELERLGREQEQIMQLSHQNARQLREELKLCQKECLANERRKQEKDRVEEEAKERNLREAFERIDALERWKDQTKAGLAIVTAIVSTAWAKILKII